MGGPLWSPAAGDGIVFLQDGSPGNRTRATIKAINAAPHRPSSTLAPTESPTPFREVDTSWATLAVTLALQAEANAGIFLSRFFTVSSAIGRFQLSPGFCAADMVDGKTCQTRWRRVITDKEKGYRVT